MPAPQSFKNHAKVDPLYHFVIAPLLLVNWIFSFVIYARHHLQHPHLAGWWVIVSLLLLLLAAKVRMYSLAVQDRVIRLEERLRLMALLPAAEHGAVHTLSMSQLIALRFASDEELPILMRRALTENLDSKQIKRAITNWRPDQNRI